MGETDHKYLALEELKILSTTIGRIEDLIYRRQGWFFSLIAGLALAFLKDNPWICKKQFLIISIAITGVSYFVELVQRIPVHGGIQRSSQVEAFLNDTNKHYDGPQISKSLSLSTGLRDLFDIGKKPRILIPYLAVLLAIYILYRNAP